MNKPLVVTLGDPTGVGPEIVVKAHLSGALNTLRPLVIAGDVGVLVRAAEIFGVGVRVATGEGLASHRLEIGGSPLAVKALSALPAAGLRYGQPDNACGQAMLDYVEWACDRCLDGSAAGLVTAPISKSAIHRAGSRFPGHTELLAQRCGTGKVVMMLGGPRLKVCLVTTHLALREVPKALAAAGILATIRITDSAFRQFFGIARPRLAVLGLNPHAGEGGLFGEEEDHLIRPAIEAAQGEGIAATGPHSADTLFHFAVKGSCDAVICMYHDQGLIPLKLLHFEDGVNTTLGLPIVRTSVDHGTAYDIAGTGQASEASLVAAIKMADQMAHCQEQLPQS